MRSRVICEYDLSCELSSPAIPDSYAVCVHNKGNDSCHEHVPSLPTSIGTFPEHCDSSLFGFEGTGFMSVCLQISISYFGGLRMSRRVRGELLLELFSLYGTPLVCVFFDPKIPGVDMKNAAGRMSNLSARL